jgi:type I restriction enzyme S subunit
MKEGWENKKLGEVCLLSAGGDVPKDNFSYIKTDDYQIPIYANGEKNEGFYGFTNKAKVTKPSITVSARGTIGYAVKRLEPFFPIVRLIVVTPINLKELGLDYLDYVLRKIDFKHSGSSIPQLTVPMIKDYEIPIPSPSEQQQIVSILDTAFEAIDKAKANAEQNLKNSKELFESYLQNIFSSKGEGWEEKKLGDVCKVTAGQSPEGKYYNKEGVGLAFYQGKKEFRDKYIGEPTTWTTVITKEAEENDILMSVRAPVGPINFATQKCCIGRGLAGIRVSNKIEKEYLFNFLLKHENEIVGNTGAVFNSINKSQIEAIKIPLPSLDFQKIIVQKIESLSKETKRLESIYQQKLIDLEELKKSLLEKAFNGELKTEKILQD